MSLDRCSKCGDFVDTDEHPEAYIYKASTLSRPKHMRDHECVCSSCQNNMIENMTEEDWERLQP